MYVNWRLLEIANKDLLETTFVLKKSVILILTNFLNIFENTLSVDFGR